MTDNSNVDIENIANTFLEDIMTNNINPQLINRRFEFQSPTLGGENSPRSIYDIFTQMPIENLILNSYESEPLLSTRENSTSQRTNNTSDNNSDTPYSSDSSGILLSHTSMENEIPSISQLIPPMPHIFNILSRSVGSSYYNTERISNLINNSLYDGPSYKKVLSEKGKKSLVKISLKEALNKEEYANINKSCPIMQTDFDEEEIITILPCKHAFHSESIERWLQEEKSQCPICRCQLDFVEEKIKCETDQETNDTTTVDTSANTVEEEEHVRRNLENILFRTYNTNPNISRLHRRNRRLYQIPRRRPLIAPIENTMNRLISSESNDLLQQAIMESIQQNNPQVHPNTPTTTPQTSPQTSPEMQSSTPPPTPPTTPPPTPPHTP